MIQVKVDTQRVAMMLGGMSRKMPIVVRNSVNDAAFELRAMQIEAISRLFPSAKPQTKKNIFVRKANASNPTATVLFDQIYNKGIDEYMLPNIEGGSRSMKPSEKRLASYYVPGIGAKLDAYGNMQGGQITQILSRMGRFGDVAGYDMNQTPASRKRLAAQRRSGARSTEYFMIQGQRWGGLKPGIYQRTESRNGFTSVGKGRGVRGKVGAFQKGSRGMVEGRGAVPVVLFVKRAPNYKAVWAFFTDSQALLDKRLPILCHHYIHQMLTGK